MEGLKRRYESIIEYAREHKVISLVVSMGFVVACAIVIVVVILRRRAKPPPGGSTDPSNPPPPTPSKPGDLSGADVYLEPEEPETNFDDSQDDADIEYLS